MEAAQKIRHMTAIALTKARFDRGHQTTFDTLEKDSQRAQRAHPVCRESRRGKAAFQSERDHLQPQDLQVRTEVGNRGGQGRHYG